MFMSQKQIHIWNKHLFWNVMNLEVIKLDVQIFLFFLIKENTVYNVNE